jgi:DNA repair exonuclease SbcCD ATPase subunit
MVTMNSATVLVAQRMVATIAAAAVVLTVCGSIARTEDAGVARSLVRDAESPVEQFSQQLEDFQKAVPDLNKSIQDSIGTIDSATDVDKARAEIDDLRATVSTLLNAISDNGPVSQLGVKALDHIHDKLKDLSQNKRFKPEERQFLIDHWRQIQDQTERATKELADARAQFAGLLQTLQENEDFVGELLEVRQAQKALEAIRSLTRDIRDVSVQLNKLIGGIKRPGV